MPLVPPAHAGAPFHRTVHLLVYCRVHLFPLLQDLLTLDIIYHTRPVAGTGRLSCTLGT